MLGSDHGNGHHVMVMAIMLWYAGFSDGTRQSAENREILEGGGCSRQPPLRLTVSVVQRELFLRFQVIK